MTAARITRCGHMIARLPVPDRSNNAVGVGGEELIDLHREQIRKDSGRHEVMGQPQQFPGPQEATKLMLTTETLRTQRQKLSEHYSARTLPIGASMICSVT